MDGTPASAGAILRDVLARKIDRNPSFSLRALARDLGVSHTYLSLVMSGKKPLSMTRAIQFGHQLGLDPKESSSLVRAATLEARGRALERARLKPARERAEPEDYFELESDRFQLLSDWYHVAILDLTLTRGFRPDPRWIARRLGLSTEQVKDSVERLKRLGLLIERNGTLVKPKGAVIVRPKKPEAAIRSFHRGMIGKALEQLESGSPAEVELRDITGLTVPIDPSRLPEAKRRIARFRLALMRFLSSGDCTELYQFNVQLFPLTSRPPGRIMKKGARK